MKKGRIKLVSGIALVLCSAILVYATNQTNMSKRPEIDDANRQIDTDHEPSLQEEASAPVVVRAWQNFRSIVNPFVRENLSNPLAGLLWENFGSNAEPIATDSTNEAPEEDLGGR